MSGRRAVHGSVARGEDRPDSDVDLLADLPPGLSLFGLGRAEADLEAIIGTRVELIPAQDLKPTVRAIPWRQIARMRDHLAHRYFDTAHAILQATVDDDLPALERAIRTLGQSPSDEEERTRT